MAILVTGCAGLVGASTTALLLRQGMEVVGIDNLNDYYLLELKQHRLDALRGRPGFQFHRLDIEDAAAVDSLFDRHAFDAVIHLAARAGVRNSISNPRQYVATNVMGTTNVLEAIRRTDVPKMVLASTSSLYAGLEMPFAESLPVNTPLSPYAATKKAAESLAWTWHHLHQLDVSVVRYFTVYGPAGRPDMSYFRFIHQIASGSPLILYGDGSQARDFTHVDDIARGTVAALKPVGHEVFNLGGSDPVTVSCMIETIGQLTGKEAQIRHRPFHDADMLATWANNDKARLQLGWEPAIGLEQGLASCVQWYFENQELAALACESHGMGDTVRRDRMSLRRPAAAA